MKKRLHDSIEKIIVIVIAAFIISTTTWAFKIDKSVMAIRKTQDLIVKNIQLINNHLGIPMIDYRDNGVVDDKDSEDGESEYARQP